MSNYKKFDISKAERLENFYENRRSLLALLIREQECNYSTIVGTKINLPVYYSREILEQILNDLGYTLKYYSFDHAFGHSNSRQFTEIIFVPKDSEATEGN